MGAVITVEQPIDGVRGVWWYNSGALVSSGMTISGGVLSRGDVFDVYSNGVAVGQTLRNYGSVTIHSGGVASGLSMNRTAGGDLTISGGTMYDADLYGAATMSRGAIHGLLKRGGGAIFASAGEITNFVLSGDQNTQIVAYAIEQQILIASGGTILGNGAKFQVRAGCSLTDVAISSGGTAWVWLAGKVFSATVYDSGYLLISGTGSASGVIVSSGGMLVVSSGASALAVTSNAGAVVTVAEGGYIEYVDQPQPIDEPVDGETGVWLKNKYSELVLSSGMSLDSLTLDSGAMLCVYSGGFVGSVLCTSAAGDAVIHVYSGGDINVFSVYGKNPATFEIHTGGLIRDLHISSAAYTRVSGGGTINNMTLWSNGVVGENLVISHLTQQTYGGLSARAATTVLSADISANHFRIHSGASAYNVTVYNGGNVSVMASGFVSGLTVSTGGKVQVLSDGSAIGVVNAGGSITSSAGAYVVYV